MPTSLVSILCQNWINISCICICIVGKYSKYSGLLTWICERTKKDLDASVWCSNVEIIKNFKHVVEEEKRIYLLSEVHRWPTFVFSISWFEVVGILSKSYFFQLAHLCPLSAYCNHIQLCPKKNRFTHFVKLWVVLVTTSTWPASPVVSTEISKLEFTSKLTLMCQCLKDEIVYLFNQIRNFILTFSIGLSRFLGPAQENIFLAVLTLSQ